jgi:RimJ/RimL family protein N-acetyltransferase
MYKQPTLLQKCTSNRVKGEKLEKTPAKIRKINSSDREDILEISSKIWGGHDYLPSVIDEWLTNPKCHTYGVEADGRIVAVGNLRLVDRGKTGWMEGLRVHVDYRRKGYANTLTQHFLSLGETLKVKRLRYTTGGNNRASIKLAKMAGFNRLFKMSVLWHENLKAIADMLHIRTTLRETTLSEANEVYRTNPDLVPHSILMYDWKALDETFSGFKEIGKDHKFYVRKKTDTLKSFSFGHARRDPESQWWSFTIYASDTNEFAAHFRNHLKIASDMGFNVTVCTTPKQFEEAFKAQKVPKLGWKMQLFMFEKQMKQKT